MATDRSPPIVLLVYANDRVDRAKHLRNLSEEIGRIRDALQTAEYRGLCQVLIEANVLADRIFSVFQDFRYRNRIAIFHYAGHANGYQLLLESASGGRGAAYAEGLADFLGQQRALELVFLNGCSTEQQVQGLLDANCSVVIATSEAIDDEVAMDFAVRFYTGLGGGAHLGVAYNEAAAAIESKKGSELRALYWGGAPATEALPGHPPWKIRTKPGAESALEWNLPNAAGDPLFGLPQPPQSDLLASPYLGLHWYTRRHAELFFGRGQEIRELYDLLTAEEKDNPIVLVYGASGVGKSSLLDAGLIPRLEADSEVRYVRRGPDLGLPEALAKALGGVEGEALKDAWHSLEDERTNPLTIILDQVESVFSSENPSRAEELETLEADLCALFHDRQSRPRGRLVLSFRKEWLAEIEDWLRAAKLDNVYTPFFVQPMGRDAVEEVIDGPTQSRRLRNKYHLTVREEAKRAIPRSSSYSRKCGRLPSASPGVPPFSMKRSLPKSPRAGTWLTSSKP